MALLGTPGSDENPADRNSAASGIASTQAHVAPRTPSFAPAVPARHVVASSGLRRVAPKPSKKRGIVNIAVMTVAAGIVATMALPAYAFNPSSTGSAQTEASAATSLKKANAQGLSVSANVAGTAVTRDTVTATSQAELDARKAAQAAAAAAAAQAAAQAAQSAAQAAAAQKAEAARQQAAVQLVSYAKSYTGPSAAQYVAAPAYPSFSLAQVFSVAQRYIGTPYVYGGATPAGFDCSGYVMFVYAQFGIRMPHSSTAQGNMGTRISIQNAVPGDLIVMPGHIGFYAGNGNIMDAPKPGGRVSIRPLWTNNYFVVRIGI